MKTETKKLISYTKPDQQVLFEDIFQNLSHYDPTAFKKKYAALYSQSYAKLRAAGDWAEERMQKLLCRELDIDFQDYTNAFLTGHRETYLALRPRILGWLGYPEGQIPKKLDKCERSQLSPDRAAQWLNSAALDRLCARVDISPSTWYRFRTGRVAPRERTLSAFRDLLALTPEEAGALKRLVRKDIIDELTRISPEVRRLWLLWQNRSAKYLSGPEEQTRLEDFWTYTAVSPKAMGAFGIGSLAPKAGAAEPPKSSQGTLLKLTIGFQLNENSGPQFMSLADSGFFDLRDTLFLTCLYLKLYDIDAICRILEFYAANPEEPDSPRLENPYKERRYREPAETK